MSALHNSVHNAEDNLDSERHGPRKTSRRRSWYRALVQDFGPMWYDFLRSSLTVFNESYRFTWCMNAGIIGILLHQYNYQFPGLAVLSTIAFIVDFILFIVFSIIFLIRFAWFKREAYHEIVNSVPDLALLACWPIAWMTIVAFVSLTVSQARWGGHSFTIVAYVMWWFAAAWIMSTLLFVLICLVNRHKIAERELPPTIFLPAVGVSTLATVGGLVSSFSHALSARLAVPVIVFAFCAVGVGIILAIFLYTYLLHRLLVRGWPPPSEMPNLFLFVGPMGQSAAALQLLGSAADTYGRFGGYGKGTFLTATAAMSLDVACILLGLLLTGMGTVWLIFALYSMFYRAFRRELVWAITWNAMIFPTGTLTTSTLLFGIEMDSPFFKVITGILIVCLLILFFVNLGFTVFEVSKGRLLIVKSDPRLEQLPREERKER